MMRAVLLTRGVLSYAAAVFTLAPREWLLAAMIFFALLYGVESIGSVKHEIHIYMKRNDDTPEPPP